MAFLSASSSTSELLFSPSERSFTIHLAGHPGPLLSPYQRILLGHLMDISVFWIDELEYFHAAGSIPLLL